MGVKNQQSRLIYGKEDKPHWWQSELGPGNVETPLKYAIEYRSPYNPTPQLESMFVANLPQLIISLLFLL
jgi:hypothetical protein